MRTQKLVTRTIQTTSVKALVYDRTTKTNIETTLVLGRLYKHQNLENEVSKILLKQYNQMLLEIISTFENSTLYGMTETEFLACAKPLDKGGVN